VQLSCTLFLGLPPKPSFPPELVLPASNLDRGLVRLMIGNIEKNIKCFRTGVDDGRTILISKYLRKRAGRKDFPRTGPDL
jgi:hypothetical protein